MEHWQDIWHTPLLWNTIGAWTLALAAFLVTFTVLPLVKGFISSRARKWRETGRELPVAFQVAAVLADRTSRIFLWTVALYFAVAQLKFPLEVARAFDVAIVVVFWLQMALWAMAVVKFFMGRRSQKDGKADPAYASSIDIILFVAGLVVWMLAFLLALDNLGVEIKPLLAGLGIGGIAVALAVQTVLGDLLASLSIALDKPFAIGDALAVDDMNGTVEHIGVKSTRLRSVSGEQIIMSNADILKSRLRNYGRMRERRSAFQLNVMYDTPVDALRAIPGMVKEIIESQPKTRFDRCHFLAFSNFALQYEVVYFMLVADYTAYADVQQTVNLEIVRRFREAKIQFSVAPVLAGPASK